MISFAYSSLSARREGWDKRVWGVGKGSSLVMQAWAAGWVSTRFWLRGVEAQRNTTISKCLGFCCLFATATVICDKATGASGDISYQHETCDMVNQKNTYLAQIMSPGESSTSTPLLCIDFTSTPFAEVALPLDTQMFRQSIEFLCHPVFVLTKPIYALMNSSFLLIYKFSTLPGCCSSDHLPLSCLVSNVCDIPLQCCRVTVGCMENMHCYLGIIYARDVTWSVFLNFVDPCD